MTSDNEVRTSHQCYINMRVCIPLIIIDSSKRTIITLIVPTTTLLCQSWLVSVKRRAYYVHKTRRQRTNEKKNVLVPYVQLRPLFKP